MNNTLTLNLPISIKRALGLESQSTARILILLIVGLGLILPLLVFYLFQVGEVVRGSYLIKVHKTELERSLGPNQVLQAEAFHHLSLEKVEEKIKDLNFVEAPEVKYIPISHDYLAREI